MFLIKESFSENKKIINEHKRFINWYQRKFNLSDYQLLWLVFFKGVILTIIILKFL